MNDILLIDSNPVNADNYRRFLTSAGFEVVIYDEFEEGLRCAAEACPALVIVDLAMLDLSPGTVLDRLRAVVPAQVSILVLACPCLAEEESFCETLFRHGADGCMAKPIARHDLLRHCHRLLDRVSEPSPIATPRP